MNELITILKIEFVINEIAEVTFIDRRGSIVMVKMSNELMGELLDIEKMKKLINEEIHYHINPHPESSISHFKAR